MKLENEYENGDINIKEYIIDDFRRYWLRVGGVSLLELKEQHMYELHDLLWAWVMENPRRIPAPDEIRTDGLSYFSSQPKG
jgi:hypothetical protein